MTHIWVTHFRVTHDIDFFKVRLDPQLHEAEMIYVVHASSTLASGSVPSHKRYSVNTEYIYGPICISILVVSGSFAFDLLKILVC